MMLGWSILPWTTALVVALSLAAAVVAARAKDRSAWAIVLAAMAVVVMSGFIAQLWVVLDRPPMRTMGETRLWYSFCLLCAGLFTYARWRYRWILSFSTLMATVFLVINCLRPEIHDSSLMPALQSAWFVPHVAVYMFSYALLGCALLLALYGFCNRKAEVEGAIEQLLYGGVAFFTVGMLTGALWAKQAWGYHWSWDPKEAWAAATWMIYLAAIHLRLHRPDCRGLFKVVVVVGFCALQMCWWGVNYLPNVERSVHTYNIDN